VQNPQPDVEPVPVPMPEDPAVTPDEVRTHADDILLAHAQPGMYAVIDVVLPKMTEVLTYELCDVCGLRQQPVIEDPTPISPELNQGAVKSKGQPQPALSTTTVCLCAPCAEAIALPVVSRAHTVVSADLSTAYLCFLYVPSQPRRAA
jgi:hypothetical protein